MAVTLAGMIAAVKAAAETTLDWVVLSRLGDNSINDGRLGDIFRGLDWTQSKWLTTLLQGIVDEILAHGGGGGAGDFFGPAGATADDFVSFADATGKLGKDSGVKASDFVLAGDLGPVRVPVVADDESIDGTQGRRRFYFSLDGSLYAAAAVNFVASLQTALAADTVTCLLCNWTDGELVTSCTLTHTGDTIPTTLTSAALTIGPAAGNLKNSLKTYYVELSVTGGGASDVGTLWEAYFLVSAGFGVGGPGAGVSSFCKLGEAPLTGAVTLSEGLNVSLTQVGNNIEITSGGGGGFSYFPGGWT